MQGYTAPTLPGQVDIPGLLAVRSFYTSTCPTQSLTTSSCSDPSGKQFTTLIGSTDCWPSGWPGLTDNSLGGKSLASWSHMVILSCSSHTVNSQTIGKILVTSSLGLAVLLRIPQFLPDGSICIIFQGGHIHQPSVSRDPEA